MTSAKPPFGLRPVAGGLRKQFAVYILASRPGGVLYIGVTSDLTRRIWEHRQGLTHGFTRKYWVKRLVHYELHDSAESAIRREKQIKRWRRDWKISLIERSNPTWDDLWAEIAIA